MSTCISREGEYSEHELAEKPEFMCSRCFAFDEDAAVAEVARLRALLAAQASTPPDITDDMAWRAAHAFASALKAQTGRPQMVNVEHARAALTAALTPDGQEKNR